MPRWHLVPLGKIVRFANDKGINGKIRKGEKEADLQSIIAMLIMQIAFDDIVEIEIDKDNGFAEFIKDF